MHVSFCKDLILTRVLGLPQSMEIDQRPDKKSRRGFTGAPTPLAGVGTTNQVPLPASFLRRGQAGSLHGLSIGACPGVRPEGGFSCLPTTPVVLCAGGMHSTLLLLLIACVLNYFINFFILYFWLCWVLLPVGFS